MIQWELFKKPESVRNNETHKIVWDFENETDNQISIRKARDNKEEKRKTST